MFTTYPVEATKNNLIHDCIVAVFKTVCDAIDNEVELPKWPEVLPKDCRAFLQSRRSLPKLIELFVVEASKLTDIQRSNFINLFLQLNVITGLLDGSVALPDVTDNLQAIIEAAKAVCDEGFSLLTKTTLAGNQISVRDNHYSIIWDSLKKADSTPKCNPSCHAAFGKDSAKKTE